jgi:hypothetical protein
MYVAGNANSVIDVYDIANVLHPTLLETITDGISQPVGISLDAAGTLYVANRTGNVTIYPAGATSPSLTLTSGLSAPVDVATDPQGNVYVADAGSSPKIVEYSPGQTTPSKTIANSQIVDPVQLSFDLAGELLYSDSTTGVSLRASGSKKLKPILQRPSYGIALDDSGNKELFVEVDATTFRGAPTNRIIGVGFEGGYGGDYKKEHLGGGVLTFQCVKDIDRRERCVWEAVTHDNKVRVYGLHNNAGKVIETQAKDVEGLAIKPPNVP